MTGSKSLVFGTLKFSFHQLCCFVGYPVVPKVPVGFNRLLGWSGSQGLGAGGTGGTAPGVAARKSSRHMSVFSSATRVLDVAGATLVGLMVALGLFFHGHFESFSATTSESPCGFQNPENKFTRKFQPLLIVISVEVCFKGCFARWRSDVSGSVIHTRAQPSSLRRGQVGPAPGGSCGSGNRALACPEHGCLLVPVCVCLLVVGWGLKEGKGCRGLGISYLTLL